MKITKGEFQLGRFHVPYRVYGEAEKTIVCVSGAKQTMAVWRSFVSYFVPDYSVAVFDLPGQGRSKILSGPLAVSLDEQVDVLHKVVCETRRDEPAHLAAASWGTIVAAAYAARCPAAVDKMILGSFGARPSKTMLEVIKEGKRLVDQGESPQVGSLIIERFGQFIPDSYKSRIIEQFQQMSREQFLAFYAHSEFVESARDIKDFVDLQNIKASTLVINGQHDAILDLEDVERACAQIPQCEFRVISDAGHFLHFEQEGILDIYKEFLSRQQPSLDSSSPRAATPTSPVGTAA